MCVMRFIVPALLLTAACSLNDDVPAPSIAAVVPARAMVGSSIALSGSAFCQQPEAGDEEDPLVCANTGSVQFGAIPVSPVEYSELMITALVPDLPPGTIQVRVVVAGRFSNSVLLTIE